MIKKIWVLAGRVAFWAAWPLLYVYLRGSERTRILVVSGQQVLVVKGWLSDGRWSLPGGGLHRRESAKSGVLRELKEETGVSLADANVKFLYIDQFNSHGLHFTYHCYVIALDHPPVPRPQWLELVAAAWVDHRQLDASNSAPDVLTAVRTWFKT